jgi:rhodanese-related sulfurtransferase
VNDEQAIAGDLSPGQAAELIEAGAELIDVRRPYEFEGGRIAGARNLEMNGLSAHAEELPRDRPIVFYCRSGNRSGMAAEAFRQAGFDAHHIAGGIEAWHADGRPLEPADAEVRPPLPAT